MKERIPENKRGINAKIKYICAVTTHTETEKEETLDILHSMPDHCVRELYAYLKGKEVIDKRISL